MDSQPAAGMGPLARSVRWKNDLRFAATGLGAAAILLAAMGASAWWAVRAQRDSLDQARMEQSSSVGLVLARNAEVLLADGQVSALRRIVTETAQVCNLERCRILLPGGEVLADSSPSGITVRDLPAKWPGTVSGAGGPNLRVFVIDVPDRGSARLEISEAAGPPANAFWFTEAGLGAICSLGLVAVVVLDRRVRSGLQGIRAVRQALLARAGGQLAPEALEVNPAWGPEAEAWNRLLREDQAATKRVALDATREQFQNRGGQCSHLAAACDALSQGLILIGTNLQAEYVNGAAAVLLQGKREEMMSAALSSFIRDERVLAAAKSAAVGQMHRRTIVEVERPEAEGGGWLRFVVRPVRRGDWGVAMIIIEDITQQRVADEARNSFVAQATHELRTPLTNIRLYAEMAIDEGKDDPVVRNDSLNIINQEVFRLDRMVGDILSIAEIEAGTLTLKKDDVRPEELLAELETDYAAQARQKGIELMFQRPPKLPLMKGDRDKIRLGLHNLIGNALKYTPAGGHVTVTVTVDQGRFVVDVADSGIGISAEDAERIFEKFYRARDRRVTQVKGSGLGLAIAREVIRLHGGDITVQSEPEKGSTFTLWLPIPPEAA
jgi:signal transduction histidine kinase